MSLLDKAMSVPLRRGHKRVTPELAELAVAWVNGRVSDAQVAGACGWARRSNVRQRMAGALLRGVQAGLITVTATTPTPEAP